MIQKPTKNNVVKNIAKVLLDSDRIMLGSHDKPDGDAVGCLLALQIVLGRHMGKDVKACVDSVPVSLDFLPGAEHLIEWKQVAESFVPDVFVALDCGAAFRLGEGKPFFEEAKAKVNIDHHASNDYFGDFNYVDVSAAAAGEQVFKLIEEMGITMDKDAAACLYAAVATDTGSFRFSNTTAHTHRIAARLHDLGFDFPHLSQQLFDTRKPEEVKLLADVLGNFSLHHHGQIAVLTITKDMLEKYQVEEAEAENYAGYARSIDGVRVAVLFKEQKDHLVRVSFRSRDSTDVNEIAALFGGGGHKKASGSVIKGSLEQAKSKVICKVAAYLLGGAKDGK